MNITARRSATLVTLILVLACRPESDQVTFQSGGPSFARSDWSEWSEPQNLGPVVNSLSVETSPALTPDELSLYFTSNRPGGLGGNDIWISQRESLDSPWGPPVNAGAPINSPFEDSHAAFSKDGHLLFVSSDRPGGQGSSDIYVTTRNHTHDDFDWGPLQPLGPDVNTPMFEAAPSYMETAENGRTNFYFSKGPVNTNLDIYSVAITRDGETLGPAELVEGVSAPPPSSDAHPSLRFDGREVVFYSTRPGGFGSQDLWIATRPNNHADWSPPQNMGPSINTAAVDIHPTLSFDGRTLLWSSGRAGSLGGRDIWMATRSPSGK